MNPINCFVISTIDPTVIEIIFANFAIIDEPEIRFAGQIMLNPQF
jgi:hypothetical protein